MSTIYLTVPGRVATTPERLASDSAVGAKFRVASTERWFNRAAGEWTEAVPVYISVICWRQLAESVLVSLRRGDPVLVHGKLVNSRFEREGRTEYRLEMQADAVGPDLRWSTAVVTRTKAAAADDPATGGEGTPAAQRPSAATEASGDGRPSGAHAEDAGEVEGERGRRLSVLAGEGAVRA